MKFWELADILKSLLCTPAWDFFCLLHEHAECNTAGFTRRPVSVCSATLDLLTEVGSDIASFVLDGNEKNDGVIMW